MAKSLAERITSAKSTDRVTITDLETLIADATAERDRLLALSAKHDAESIDFALSDEDREEAAQLANHYQRTARGLANEIDALKKQLEEKRESDSRKAAEAEKQAAIDERDALAVEFMEFYRPFLQQAAALNSRIDANATRLASLRLHELNAEAKARGLDVNGYKGPSMAELVMKMKMPDLDGPGRIWPAPAANPMALANESSARQMARMRDDQARENARWARYMVEPPKDGTRTFIETRRGMMPIGVSGYRNAPVEAVMTAEGVKDAEANGCTVSPLAHNESVGLPPDVAVLA